MPKGSPKVKQCTMCGRVAHTTASICEWKQDGVPCVGRMRVLRYPTDDELGQADERRQTGIIRAEMSAFDTGWAVVKSGHNIFGLPDTERGSYAPPERKVGECEICRGTPAKMTTVRNHPDGELFGAMLCGPCAEREGKSQ